MHDKLVWGTASVISLVLLSAVITQIDWLESMQMVQRASVPFLAMALVCLFAEGIFTALRLWLFARKKPCLSEALKANAWYVLLLILLPARLGEVAAVVVLEKHLEQSRGAAAMSIIVQRLYDVIILSAVFLIALLALGNFVDQTTWQFFAFGLIMLVFAVFFLLEVFLTWGALILPASPKKFFGKLRPLILQARTYVRHGLVMRDIPLAIFLTLLKWIGNLGALVFLFLAIHLELNFFESITISAAYNFLAVIPLQTIGGIGVGEAGLALLFAGAGLSKSISAGASLMIRLVILIFPFLFWGSIMGGLHVKERLTDD